MGISRNNGEGYPDPTAHIAVRNVEADAKKLKINYPTGYIELNLERTLRFIIRRNSAGRWLSL